jgi:ABC-type multidrug transport system ATPase subunit
VFVSSHLMSEMENTADHLIVIGRGKLIADCTVANSRQTVRVRTPQPDLLAKLAASAGATVRDDGDGVLIVSGLIAGLRLLGTACQAGRAAARSARVGAWTPRPRP